MLRSSYTFFEKMNGREWGVATHISEPEGPRPLAELLEVVDRFAAMATDLDDRFPPGVNGDHAWISIIDQGFVMHAYFDQQGIKFELYGPKPVGKEKEYGDPYDGSGLNGEVEADTLKHSIMVLDQGQSPRDYLRENAKECWVIED